jgi:hypothetical protein
MVNYVSWEKIYAMENYIIKMNAKRNRKSYKEGLSLFSKKKKKKWWIYSIVSEIRRNSGQMLVR